MKNFKDLKKEDLNKEFNTEMNEKKQQVKKALEVGFNRQWNNMHKEDFLDEVLKFIEDYNN